MDNARVIASKITSGETPTQNLGKKTYVVLRQEIESLFNSYNPSTMIACELNDFKDDLHSIIDSVNDLDDDLTAILLDLINTKFKII